MLCLIICISSSETTPRIMHHVLIPPKCDEVITYLQDSVTLCFVFVKKNMQNYRDYKLNFSFFNKIYDIDEKSKLLYVFIHYIYITKVIK